jgi:macrolide-specific efflux system membrane fusion protein
MLIHSLITAAALALAPAADRPTISTSEPTIDECQVHSIQDLPVPASDAGVLMKLHVDAGAPVEKGVELATIDNREAAAVYKVKELEYQIAKQTADSNIDIRHAEKAADVAKKTYDKFKYINENQPGAVTQIDLLRHQFEWERALLSIEKAKEDAKSHKLTAESKKAESDAALVALERRTLVAPFNGVVVKTYLQEGEWVQPGDPVVQLVRIDRLRVHGDVDASKWNRADLEGRRVTVELTLPRGREIKVPGKIMFVSPVVGVGAKLPVYAEIDTPMENGRPLVYAGMEARMIIHTNQPVAAAPARPRPANVPAAAGSRGPAISQR